MAREVSALQEVILRLALERGGFVSSRAIILHAWGSSLTPGEPGYESAHASLSRSLARLFSRGMVDIFKKNPGAATGTSATVVGLTPWGEEWARYLAEKEKRNCG